MEAHHLTQEEIAQIVQEIHQTLHLQQRPETVEVLTALGCFQALQDKLQTIPRNKFEVLVQILGSEDLNEVRKIVQYEASSLNCQFKVDELEEFIRGKLAQLTQDEDILAVLAQYLQIATVSEVTAAIKVDNQTRLADYVITSSCFGAGGLIGGIALRILAAIFGIKYRKELPLLGFLAGAVGGAIVTTIAHQNSLSLIKAATLIMSNTGIRKTLGGLLDLQNL